MSIKIALDIANGGFPRFFEFPARQLDMMSSSPLKINEYTISNVQPVHPYGDSPALDVAGRSGLWGCQAGCSST